MTRYALMRTVRRMQSRVLVTANPSTPREKQRHTRACNCLAVARRQLAAMDAGRPVGDWIEIRLQFNPCDPSHFLPAE